MAAWGLLILIIVIIILYFVVSKVYYEHKIKAGRQRLAGKVRVFLLRHHRFGSLESRFYAF